MATPLAGKVQSAPWFQQLRHAASNATCSPALREPVEPVDVQSELDAALELADSRLARCWAIIEEMNAP